MKIYADILFFMNFYADFLCLSLASEFADKKVLGLRKVLGAVLGGVFGVIAFFPDMRFFDSFLLSLGFAFVMVIATFTPCRAKELFKGIFYMYLFSGLFSGAMMFFLWNIGGGVVKNGVFYTKDATLFFVLFAIYKGFLMSKKFLFKKVSKKISCVKICYKGKIIKADGFFDTGNNLIDPISGQKVMMIDESVLKRLINDECTADNLSEWVDCGLRVIPYKTVADSGILFGFFSDYVMIDNKRTDKALLCVSREKLAYPVILQV